MRPAVRSTQTRVNPDSVDVWSTEMMERKLRDARDMIFAEFDDATKVIS